MNLNSSRTGLGYERVARWGLGALYLIAAASIAGFGIFRVWPQLLATPGAAEFYPKAYSIFPRVQIAFAFLVLAAVLVARVRWRWVLPFVAVYVVSLGSELAGTTVGLPFGPYSYTELLGAKWFGHVPLLIPLSWFTMALPSYVLAARAGSGSAPSRVRRVIVASLILLAWDLSLDPAMSEATKYWVWGTSGVYYGMPFMNLVGWFVTGVALMATFALLRVDHWVTALPRRWMAAFYGANLALPLGMALAAGMWVAVLATIAALGVCAALREPRRTPHYLGDSVYAR